MAYVFNKLVLFSCEQNAWKIADFGITTEGTSELLLKTGYARGTACYRAPELLSERAFNNKADIWAMGCILYELVCGQKAFSSDFNVLHYSSGAHIIEFPSSLDVLEDQEFRVAVTETVSSTLKVNPSERPTAQELNYNFLIALQETTLSGTHSNIQS